MPGHAHLATRITGFEQPEQLGLAALVEALVSLGQQPPCSRQGVILAASVADGLVLHPPAALVQLGVGELDEMERIGDLGDVAQGVVEGLARVSLRAAAMVRAGVDPGLLEEVIWWRTDDLWFWALEALVTYVRAAAERRPRLSQYLWSDREPPRRPASSHDLTSTPRSLIRGRTEHAGGRWRTHAERRSGVGPTAGPGAPDSVIGTS